MEVRILTGKPGKDGGEALRRGRAQPSPDVVMLDHAAAAGLRDVQVGVVPGARESAGVSIKVDAVDRTRLPAWVGERLAQQQQRVEPGEPGRQRAAVHRRQGGRQPARRTSGNPKLGLLYPPGGLTFDQVHDARAQCGALRRVQAVRGDARAAMCRASRACSKGCAARARPRCWCCRALTEEVRVLSKVRQGAGGRQAWGESLHARDCASGGAARPAGRPRPRARCRCRGSEAALRMAPGWTGRSRAIRTCQARAKPGRQPPGRSHGMACCELRDGGCAPDLEFAAYRPVRLTYRHRHRHPRQPTRHALRCRATERPGHHHDRVRSQSITWTACGHAGRARRRARWRGRSTADREMRAADHRRRGSRTDADKRSRYVNARDVERARAKGQDAAFIDRLTLSDKARRSRWRQGLSRWPRWPTRSARSPSLQVPPDRHPGRPACACRSA